MDDLLTSYGAAIESLFARTTGGIKPGLERTEALLAKLGSPHLELAALHVAGTNGKGSVVATCEALLRRRGYRVGRYTSPHLIDFRERITVDGVPISEEEVLAFLERWIPLAEDLGATFFEITTALAFDWLARQKVDYAVIETGLGGRLDSTNVLKPLVSTVTSIGLDHTDLLGETLEAIAREKAGIFKQATPAVIGESSPPIRELLRQCAESAGASAVVLDDAYRISDVVVAPTGTSFNLGDRASGAETRVKTSLIGLHQARNTAISIATVRAIGENLLPASQQLNEALTGVVLPGRFQRVGKFIFDVAHNPDGARTVATSLASTDPPRPLVALVAVLADKDWRGIISELSEVVDRFVFTNAPSAPVERRWNPADANAFARTNGLTSRAVASLDDAIAEAEQGAGTVVVTGSFHTVGDVMSRLQVSPFAA
ncbi:MAG TPA: folylpolyglutamate synthase/dihydrofolate synthase family protein [Gemmatimonadaceae bacterium]|nr:folylpolyglutamate synthase/dihydrofolate synthase family protein [Gemmatimonadaceae bacterium]